LETLKYNSPAYSDEITFDHRGSPYEEADALPEASEEEYHDLIDIVLEETSLLSDDAEVNQKRRPVVKALSFKGFDSSNIQGDPLDESHEIPIPLSIRLRRASEQYQAQSSQRKRSLSLLYSGSVAKPSAALTSPAVFHKSSIASAAVTHTNVNPFVSDTPAVTKELKQGQMKLNATLQIVQSRDSIYEVIWEDRPVQGSDVGEPVKPTPTKPEPVNNELATWTWGHRPQTPSSLFSMPSHGKVINPPRSASKSIACTVQANNSSEAIDSAEQAVANQKLSSPDRRLSLDVPPEAEETIEPLHRRRASVSDGHLTPQQRRLLLGNRKLSNLSPEEEHFSTHRDSLLLAHRRIFRDEVGTSHKVHPPAEEPVLDPHILQMRHDTWSLPRAEIEHASIVGQASAPEYNTFDLTVSTSESPPSPVHHRDKGKGKKRVYVLSKECEPDDESGSTPCLR